MGFIGTFHESNRAFKRHYQFMKRDCVRVHCKFITPRDAAGAAEDSVVLKFLEDVHEQGDRQAAAFGNFTRRGDPSRLLGQVREGNKRVIRFFAK